MTDPSPADRLEAGVQGLRVPEPRTDRESLLLKVGVAIVLIGGLCIGLGWWGASGTANLAEQIPYLISGGSSASPSWWPEPGWSCATRWPGCSGSGWPGSSPSTASRPTGRWTPSAASRAPWAGRGPPAGSVAPMALRVALVTGAGSGMGRLAARRLAADGIEVAAVDVDADGLAETGDLSPTISPLVCDVTDDAAVEELVGWVEKELGPIHRVVAAAGIAPTGPLVDQPTETILGVMDVNYGGVVRVVKAALPAMLDRGTGEVVVFASLAGWMPTPSLGAYSRDQARARGVLRGAVPRAPRHWSRGGVRVPAAGRHADDPPARGRRDHVAPEDHAAPTRGRDRRRRAGARRRRAVRLPRPRHQGDGPHAAPRPRQPSGSSSTSASTDRARFDLGRSLTLATRSGFADPAVSERCSAGGTRSLSGLGDCGVERGAEPLDVHGADGVAEGEGAEVVGHGVAARDLERGAAGPGPGAARPQREGGAAQHPVAPRPGVQLRRAGRHRHPAARQAQGQDGVAVLVGQPADRGAAGARP